MADQKESEKTLLEFKKKNLEFLVELSKSMHLPDYTENIGKILKDYRNSVEAEFFYQDDYYGRNLQYSLGFHKYYSLITGLYCCSTKFISDTYEISENDVKKMKDVLWQNCNESERNFLKLHNTDTYGLFDSKVAQFEHEIFKNFEQNIFLDEDNLENREKLVFNDWGINLNELPGYWMMATNNQIHWWRKFLLPKLAKEYEISLEEAVKQKMSYLSYQGSNYAPGPTVNFQIDRDQSHAGSADFYKIYFFIFKEFFAFLFPDKFKLPTTYPRADRWISSLVESLSSTQKLEFNKINKIAVRSCFIGGSTNYPSLLIFKKYLSLDDKSYSELKDELILKGKFTDPEIEKENEKTVYPWDEEHLISDFTGLNGPYSELNKEEFESTESEKNELLKGKGFNDQFAELNDAKQELEKEIQVRKKLVAQYSHTLGNILIPEKILEVAEELKALDNNSKFYRILFRSYQSELMVRRQGELLRTKHGDKDSKEFHQFILKDRLEDGSNEDAINVMEILSSAAETTIWRILNRKSAKLKAARKKLVKKSGMDLKSLQKDLEDNVLFSKKQSVFKWINNNLGNTKIGNLSSTWKRIRLRKDGYAHSFLYGHWGEMFFNTLKYTNHGEDELLTLEFKESTEKKYNWLEMIWKNPHDNKDIASSGEGLQGIAEDLVLLNQIEGEKYLRSEKKKNYFEVRLNYRSDMLVPLEGKKELIKKALRK